MRRANRGDNGLHDRSRCQTIPGNPTTRPIYIRISLLWPIYVSNCIYETYYALPFYPRSLDSWRPFPNRCRAATVSNGRTTVSKTVALCTTRLSILQSIILDRIVCKSLTLCVRTHPLQNVPETWFTTPCWINPARSCRCHGRNGRSWKNACGLY
jgi:hypothetical protein